MFAVAVATTAEDTDTFGAAAAASFAAAEDSSGAGTDEIDETDETAWMWGLSSVRSLCRAVASTARTSSSMRRSSARRSFSAACQ